MGVSLPKLREYARERIRLKSVRQLSCFVLLVICCEAIAQEPQKTLLYVQVICANNNNDEPRQAGWKAIGPKLRKHISPVFRWKTIGRQVVIPSSLSRGR